MKKTSLSARHFLLFFVLGVGVLSGCVRLEVKENMHEDGTSDIVFRVDMSQMLEGMENIKDSFSYTGCNDPELLKEFHVTTLSSELQEISFTQRIRKQKSCKELGEGEVEIAVTEAFFEEGKAEPVGRKSYKRKVQAQSCEDPLLLVKENVKSFPAESEEVRTFWQRVSCEEKEDKIKIKVEVLDEGGESKGRRTQIFPKKDSTAVKENPMDKFCEENINFQLLPFDFVKCEKVGEGIAQVHYVRKNTDVFQRQEEAVVYDISYLKEALETLLTEGKPKKEENPFADLKKVGGALQYALQAPWKTQASFGNPQGNIFTFDFLVVEDVKDPLLITLETSSEVIAKNTELPMKVKVRLSKALMRIGKKLSSHPKGAEVAALLQQRIEAWAAQDPEKRKPIADFLSPRLLALKNFLQEKNSSSQ